MTLSMLAAAGRANEGLYKLRRIACFAASRSANTPFTHGDRIGADDAHLC